MKRRGKRSEEVEKDGASGTQAPSKRHKADTTAPPLKPFALTYFENQIQQSGLLLSDESSWHILTCQPLSFVSKLKTVLEKNVDFPRNVIDFVKGFDIWTEDEDHLDSILIPKIKLQLVEDEVDPVSESVLRLLVKLECLQEPLTTSILKRANIFAIEDKPDKVKLLLKPFILLDNMMAESILVTGLIELLQISERTVRQEIITCLPELISHQLHESVALELFKLMTCDYELTPVILDCLTYFNLSSDVKSQVQRQMLTALQTSAPIHFFPNLIKFFFIGCSGEDDSEMIQGLREGLDWTSPTGTTLDIESSQVMTVMSLKSALLRSKNLNVEWLKVINKIKLASEHKPLDIVILLIMHSIGSGKEKLVENVFRKKIKSSTFTCSLLSLMLKKMKPIIKDYLGDCLKLAKSLLKSKNDPSVKEFSIHWFVILFKELKESQKTVVYSLMNQDLDEAEPLSNSLTVLMKISENNMDSLKPFSLQILTLIDKADVLNTVEMSRLMDLLCGLAFRVENSVIKDDIHMLIQKQLTSSDLTVNTRGIASGIMAVKHIACSVAQKEPIIEDELMNITDLPNGNGKDAALITKLILKSTNKCPEMVCCFYDQFADMLSTCQNVDGKYLTWLLNNFTNDFQNSFIADIPSIDLQPIDGIELSQQFCLDEIKDLTEPIGLNIGTIVFGENTENVNLQLLPSWFRVIQVIHKKAYDGDLSTIDALLGCAIIMPVLDDDVGLEEFNSSHYDKLLNCFVHCINWFRELICAFSSQTDVTMRKKTLGRLNDLLLLESKLTTYLGKTLHPYKPPVSTYNPANAKFSSFVVKENKTKKGTKKPGGSKKKDTENIAPNETLRSQINASIVNSQAVTSNVKCKLNTDFFRSIHFEVICLLSESLCIEDLDEDPQSNVAKIDLSSLLFLLDEINPKLSNIFPSRIKKQSHFKSAKLITIEADPAEALNKCITLLPKLCQNMELIAEYAQKLLDSYDGVRDALGLFTEQNAKAQMCLAGIFQMLTHIFSWVGFRSNDNIGKLKEGLKILACRKDANNSKLSSLKEHILETTAYVLQYKDYCLVISTAASLVKFFQVLAKIIDDSSVSEVLANISIHMLSQIWRDVFGDLEKGLVYNQHVDALLAGYFSKPSMEVIKSLALELHEESPDLVRKNHVLNKFQCINKTNFPLLFRSMCRALYEATTTEIDKGLTDRRHLELWKDVTIVMKYSTDILKIVDNRTNLSAFLKQSIPLLRLFLSQGMPMMDLKLKNDPDSVVEILKTLQHTTRFLHSLYCHSRLKKDTALIAYLPQLKLILETLVYKVKASLTMNNCSEAFWMGNLKNKNLQGELISSQVSTAEQSDEEDQLPEDDDSPLDSDLDDSDMKSVSSIC
ncbi:Fanconi anemia complementation group D2 [Arctopsyche grandis]|uniref:Fanconi anemia complementation group D2 n=1 Tax=Arctopsyche grandis TaxID=121162 RepID=UPI00406D81D5